MGGFHSKTTPPQGLDRDSFRIVCPGVCPGRPRRWTSDPPWVGRPGGPTRFRGHPRLPLILPAHPVPRASLGRPSGTPRGDPGSDVRVPSRGPSPFDRGPSVHRSPTGRSFPALGEDTGPCPSPGRQVSPSDPRNLEWRSWWSRFCSSPPPKVTRPHYTAPAS